MLELGGNAAAIIDEDADIDYTVDRLIFGAFYQSGQSCIGVQRILVHDRIYDSLKSKLVEKASSLIAGDPKNEKTFVGPMIAESEACRLSSWIDEALDAGGKLLCGGKRDGALLEATILEDVPKSASVCTEEAFGPVAVLQKFSTWEQAIEMVNDSKFGLQAGVFTRGCLQDTAGLG